LAEGLLTSKAIHHADTSVKAGEHLDHL